ncbi:MAG: hypothetical protein Q8R28_14450 [Dehalococcoidia bacterium]|nr:hypothetical protein [Dehalococcoidia bacterium]
MPDYEETLYEETVKLDTWIVSLVGVVLLALVGTIIGLVLNGVPANDRIGLPISALVTVVIALVFWNYREIRIRVTRHALEARYGVLNQTVIPLSEIESCQPTRARFGRYLGVGVRMGLDGSIAYTTSFGTAVEIRRRSRRPFVVSTNRSLELSQVVNAALQRTRG